MPIYTTPKAVIVDSRCKSTRDDLPVSPAADLVSECAMTCLMGKESKVGESAMRAFTKRLDTVTNLFADLCGDIGDGALRDAGEDGRLERVLADVFNEAQNPWSDG